MTSWEIQQRHLTIRAAFLSLIAFFLGCLACWGLAAMRTSSNVGTRVAVMDVSLDAHTGDGISTSRPGDWPQWGGTSIRNNTPDGKYIPSEWDCGSFDRITGRWDGSTSENIKWVANLGSQTYGNPVVANGQVYVGTNNGAGYLARYPASVDLGCLLAFEDTTGKFLWQHSSEKLPTGRVHDWPLQGICCAPLVEGDRLWFVTSRGEVKCLDTQGYYDGEDDGPEKGGMAVLFREPPSIVALLDQNELPPAIEALLIQAEVELTGRVRVDVEEPGRSWKLTIRAPDPKLEPQVFSVSLKDGSVRIEADSAAQRTAPPTISSPADLTAGLDKGAMSLALRALLKTRGLPVEEIKKLVPTTAGGAWEAVVLSQGHERELILRREGPSICAYKQVTSADRDEADVVWTLDMMEELKVSQHNMCSCSVTALGDILFVCTSNGVDESHIVIPNIEAPSFIAVDKHTGKVLWTDASPGANIVHGQWSSPAVAVIDNVPQVIFAGGDGWLYAFRADGGRDGKPELLWKFDANPKKSKWELGGRGTRNEIIGTPVVYKDRVYLAVGQDPEHGEGEGHLWCIDPTKRGDISAELAVYVNDRTKIVPHKRLQAVVEEDGEIAIDNPNSGVIWHYSQFDQNGDGKFSFEECMHRSCGTAAIKDDLLFMADFSGIFHCVDAMTGKVHWTFDLMAQCWGSALVVDGKVYIGDEDGEVAVFRATAEPHEPISVNDMHNSVYSTPIIAHDVMYISNKTHLFAIEQPQ